MNQQQLNNYVTKHDLEELLTDLQNTVGELKQAIKWIDFKMINVATNDLIKTMFIDFRDSIMTEIKTSKEETI